MQIVNVQPANNTSFGTRYGRNLQGFIQRNKDILTSDNFKNLSMIRNNGINSVLELEDVSLKERELYHCNYKLNLTGGVMDKKNEVMRGYDRIHYIFKNYIAGNYTGKTLATDDRFPIYIKNDGAETVRHIAKQFDSKNLLVEKIEKEYEQSKIINKEFEQFKENI